MTPLSAAIVSRVVGKSTGVKRVRFTAIGDRLQRCTLSHLWLNPVHLVTDILHMQMPRFLSCSIGRFLQRCCQFTPLLVSQIDFQFIWKIQLSRPLPWLVQL